MLFCYKVHTPNSAERSLLFFANNNQTTPFDKLLHPLVQLLRTFTTIVKHMKRFYTATGIFFAIQAVHYFMLMPLVMYDPNKTE